MTGDRERLADWVTERALQAREREALQRTRTDDPNDPGTDHHEYWQGEAEKFERTAAALRQPPGDTGERAGPIYVASSWRNERQPGVVSALKAAGHQVYDFRHPEDGDDGFHWSEIDPAWQTWTPQQFRQALTHPIAVAGFGKDMRALDAASACVLVMPCGRSAHLELGHAIGAKKPTAILLSDGEPELMYGMADLVTDSLDEIKAWLAALSPEGPPPTEDEKHAFQPICRVCGERNLHANHDVPAVMTGEPPDVSPPTEDTDG